MLAGLIALALLAGIPPLLQRVRAEGADRSVELVADQADFTAVAEAQGVDPATFLRRMHAAGITSLGVAEDTLKTLADQGLVQEWTGADLKAAAELRPLPSAFAGHTPRMDRLYVYVSDPTLGAWLRTSLQQRLAPGRVTAWRAGDATVVAVRGDKKELEALGLGFRPGRLSSLASLGFTIVPRLSDDPQETAAAIGATVAQAAAQAPVHTVIFAGEAVTGYPDQLAATAEALAAAGWDVGAIETPPQLGNVDQSGITTLVAARPGAVVRVYSLPAWVLQQMQPAQVNQTILDGITGRNLRVIYLHPYTAQVDPAGHVLADNVTRWGRLAARIRALGYHLGPARPFPQMHVRKRYRILLNLGVLAGALWLLFLLLPATARRGWWWLVAGGILVAGATAVRAGLAAEAGGLGAAVVFPSLAGFYVARTWDRWERGGSGLGRIWWQAVLTAVIAAATAAIGAYLLSALLSNTAYMQEWSFFRGVKVSYVMPPLVTSLAFLVAVGVSGRRQGLGQELGALGRIVIRGAHLLGLAVLLGAAGYYVLRSGNVSYHAVSSIEETMRTLLSRFFVDRPREKEFLVGYPSFFLAVYAAARRHNGWFWMFLLGGSVGLVSLVNSFEHVRTPLLVSVHRGLYGLLLGAVIGTVVLLVVWAVERVWTRSRGGTP